MKLFAFIPLLASTFATATELGILARLLNIAVEKNMPDKAASIIEAGFAVDTPITQDGITALMLSAELGKLRMIDYLISVGASLNAVDSLGCTALHFACGSYGSTEGLRACLAKGGADLEKMEFEQGNTALHFAAANGSFDKVKALLEAGANIEATNMMGNTPLIAACFKDNVKVVIFLIGKGADFLAKNRDDQDALAVASHFDSINFIRILLSRINPSKANINIGIIRALGHAKTPEMKDLIQSFIPATVSFIPQPKNI